MSFEYQNQQQYQPVSIYEYSKVGDVQIQEDWLKRSPNIIDYRQKLYQAFADSQTRYLQRKNERRIINQVENPIPMDTVQDFYSVDPKITSLALQKRKIVKESRGQIKRNIERWFVIDNFLITFFKREGDQDFKKNATLQNAFVLVERFDDQSDYKWYDLTKDFRVQIRLPARQILPIFYYTDDLHEAHIIACRIYMASSQKREEIGSLLKKVSTFETLFRFRAIWNRIFKVYENRLLKMISFQIMGINLIELANTGWYQREKLFRFWSGQILKREKIPLLRSTFRFGAIKRQLDPDLYRSSLMVREQLRRIANAFKNRRLQRHSAIQQDINTLLEEEELGSQCQDILIKFFNGKDLTFQYNYKLGNIKIDKNQYLSLEKLQDKTNGEFYERNPPIKFLLEYISYIATSCKPFDKNQESYRLRLYGRTTIDASKDDLTNLSPHQLGLDILRREPKEVYQVKIQSIEISVKLAQQFNLKADVRVRLKQAKTLDQFDTHPFYINSRPYRISVPPDRQKGRIVIKGYDYTFTIDKLDPNNPDEVFQLYIVLQRYNVPVTQFMKEFLFEEEFLSKKYFKFETASNLEAKVSDSMGNKMKLKFSVTKVQNNSVILPDEREGKRLHIGRYALYRKRIVIVKSIDKDMNCKVQFLNKPSKIDTVALKKINLIEKKGVNVFDIDNLPNAIRDSQNQFVIELVASNKRLVNTITSAIQNRQLSNSFEQRSFFREVKRDIEGQILVSLVEVLNIKQIKNCQPYVKITVEDPATSDVQSLQYISTVNQNTQATTWVSNRSPSGEIVNLGNFFKEEVNNIKFEVFNKRGAGVDSSSDQLLGEIQLTTNEFIDIEKPGKEISLILENKKDKSYIFLVIQSLFVPTNVTRIEYQLTDDMSIYSSPEQYFHQIYMQKQYELDTFNYPVPLTQYFPNYLEKISQKVLNELEQQLTPGISSVRNKQCSPEEKLSMSLKYQNMQRPEIEEGVLFFKYLWKHRVLFSKQQSFNELQNRFWSKFISDMEKYAATHQFTLQIKDNEVDGELNHSFDHYSNIDGRSTILNQNNQKGAQIFDWFKQKPNNPQENTSQISKKQAQQLLQKKFILLFNSIWENEEGQQYADTYYLIQSGIPPQLRIKIWKDLLKTEVIEFEESRHFQKHFEEFFDEQKSVYENMRDYSSRQDCLAFRQIDEDIEYYQFPKLYHEDDDHLNKVIALRDEKRKMRNILRVLILWSRNKKYDNRIISYNYTKGMLHILQRMITIASEEDTFWILNSMIRQIPRLFSTEVSCLEGGRNSAMRNEMTAFKAVLRENLPQVCDKLRLLGLPVDQMIYDSMTSFYSHFFSSEVVLRLWDQIIFNFSNNDRVAKKRALWYLMAPAYLVIREKTTEIMNAQSIQQVLDIYSNGSSLSYNPDWVVNELKVLIRDIFVTGIERLQDGGQSKLSLGFNKLINRGGNNVDKAQLLEQTRKNYEADLSLIFNSIEEENKQIGILLEKTNFFVNPRNPQYLDYIKWRQHVMARFKKVALKNQDDFYDDLYEYEEPEMNKEDMDLSKINLYLHQIQNLNGIRLFKIRLLYGRIINDLQVLEERYSEDVYKDTQINQYHAFEYLKGYNQVKVEILDNQNDDQVVCELIVDLRELNSNRFIKKYYQMRNEYLVENLDSYRQPFTVFVISFFLQTHTTHQHDELMKSRNTQMSQFINSIKRKLPDRIDIFNKKNETEFVEHMKHDFKRIIKEEFEALSNFLPEQQARNTINDNFNFIEDSDFGNITIGNLQYLVKQCFFTEWLPYLDSLYKIFVKEEENKEEDMKQNDDDGNLNDDSFAIEDNKGNFNVFTKIKDVVMKKPQSTISGTQNQLQKSQNNNAMLLEGRTTIKKRSKLPFSLRNFIVSLVLMSHCTVNEKLDILYDLFDWNDGVADGLDMNSMFMLIKTIFERNLYYWPSHELFNLVEMAFDLSVSSIYQVLWTKEINVSSTKKYIKLKDLLARADQIKPEEKFTIDCTDEMLENINSYQRMFGNKNIDFNVDSSAFKKIDTLIKGGKKMIENTSQGGGKYRLVIFYLVSSERYQFEVEYDNEGQLIKNRDLDEKDDIDEYLKRNINKLYLTGRSKGISKKEFLLKTSQIPFLQDLIRVETIYRDRFQSTLQKKNKLEQELIILINEEDMQFIFRFQSRVMQNIEGDMQVIDQKTFRILMAEAYEQDTISDIRERIVKVMIKVSKKEKQIQDKHITLLRGAKDFFLKEDNSIKWRMVNEYDRLVEFKNQNQAISRMQKEIILKMEQTKHQGEDKFMNSKEEERDLAGFDCYSLYKHCDNSYEWRLCKIMQKEPFAQNQGINGMLSGGAAALDVLKKDSSLQQFYYWIEFLHHRKTGQKLWLKRRREEILISARYAREQQRNYQQTTLKFIRDLYQEILPHKECDLKFVQKNVPDQSQNDQQFIQQK